MFCKLAALLALLALAHGHSTGVLFCRLPSGDLRILVENWHTLSENQNPGAVDTMTIKQDVTIAGVTTTTQGSQVQDSYVQSPVNPTDFPTTMTALEFNAGCLAGSLQIVSECAPRGSSYTFSYGIFSIFDFKPAQCGDDVQLVVSMLQSNSLLLSDSCGLLPAVVPSINFPDDVGPVVMVNGVNCGDVRVSGCAPVAVDFTLAPVDSCDANPQITGQSHQSGDTFQPGSTPVTVTTLDETGNVGTCTFNVIVAKNFGLTASSTPAICASATDGTIDLTIAGGEGTGPFTVAWSNGATTEDLTGLAPGAYTAVVTDANQCTDSITKSVLINIGAPVEPPTITCPDDVTVFCSSNVPADFAGGSATPNCGAGLSVSHSDTNNGGAGCTGDELVITRTYTATDSGGQSSCTQIITVAAEDVSVTASNDQIIKRGECATIDYSVTVNHCPVTAAWDDNNESGQREVCPKETTTYGVEAVAPCSQDSDSVTISVAQPHLRYCEHGRFSAAGTMTGWRCRCPEMCPVCVHSYWTLGEDLFEVVGKECKVCRPMTYYHDGNCVDRCPEGTHIKTIDQWSQDGGTRPIESIHMCAPNGVNADM